jgi:hypothetical protein
MAGLLQRERPHQIYAAGGPPASQACLVLPRARAWTACAWAGTDCAAAAGECAPARCWMH